MNNNNTPINIVKQLLKNDPFSQWMEIEILEAKKGYCKCRCIIKQNMLNGFAVTHGGILFSLADTTLAFAAATYGKVSLSIEHSISFIKKTEADTTLISEATCLHMGSKTGVIKVDIYDSENNLIATTKGIVYRTDKIIHS
jgi:acyl-CoA thioesterase